MSLEDKVRGFIGNPVPLWETELESELTFYKWKQLTQLGIINEDAYTTERIWLNNPALEPSEKILIAENDGKKLYLEKSSVHLKSFYQEQGLESLNEKELESNSALDKLNSALAILRVIKPAYTCIINLVRTIQVLRNDDPEVDLSYSHPKIPFSIFVSVCEDDLEISNLRVAESVLHEAMHLKLTLIEEIFPLVKKDLSERVYSPWKKEERPILGVLHGLFVFKTINEFYRCIINDFKRNDVKNFINKRLEETYLEISSLSNFHKNSALSEIGRSLALKLTQY
jgi:HEXXH motif-containing protein